MDTRDRATVQYDEAVKERAGVQQRVDKIRGYLTALPRLTALRGIRARLAPLAEIPDAPQAWAVEVPRLQKQEIELGVKISAVADEIGQLADEVRAVIVDETALSNADRVERLVDLRARYVTAEKDLPERRLQLRELDSAISGILQRVERPEEAEPKRLVLSAATIGRLRDLIETRSGIEAANRNASEELAEARRRLDEVAAKLPEGGADPQLQVERKRAFAGLAVVVEALRSADHHVRRRLAERDRAAALDALNDRVVALRPWQGTADELVAMHCPSAAALQDWKLTRGDAVSTKSRCDAEVQRLTTIVRRLEAEKASFGSTTGVVSDHEAAEVRSQREQAWAAHRRTLDTASADSFESVLRHDDIVTAGRFSHMGELAKLHQTEQALAVAETDLTRAVELAEQAEAALGAIDAEVMIGTGAIAPTSPRLRRLWSLRRGSAGGKRRLRRVSHYKAPNGTLLLLSVMLRPPPNGLRPQWRVRVSRRLLTPALMLCSR